MSKSSALLMGMVLNQTSDPLAKKPVERDIFWKSKDYYTSCIRKDLIRKKGFTPMLPLANLILSKFEHKNKPLLQILGELQGQTGVKIVFQSRYSSVPAHNIHELRLQIVPSQAYKVSLKTIRKVMKTFVDHGVLPSDTSLTKITKWIWLFEKRHLLFSKHLNRMHSRKKDKPDQYQSIETLNKQTDMDWNLYLKSLKLDGVKKAHLWAESQAWMRELSHLQDIDRNLLKYYALWRLAVDHFNKLPEPYYSLWKKKIYKKKIKMRFYSVDRAMTFLRHDCVKETGANLKYLAGHLFIKYAFNTTQKARAEEMVDNLFETLRNRFLELEWMDHSTKRAAIKKLDNLVRIVGFPDWVMDPYEVADYYKPLKFKPNSYFENAVQAQIFTELMPSIRHSRNNDIERDGLFKDHMWLLNAVHLVNLVQIQINPGFIQRPLFSELNPSAMNYGSLGGVIGHEMTHAFDSFGSQFDSEGVRRPWMSPESRRIYNSKTQCFVDQYSDMHVTLKTGQSRYVNGEHTLTENLADNGGMHISWNAWTKLEKSDVFEKQPGHDWSPAQIFWLAYAQTNCDVSSDKKIKRQLKKDVHSPKPVRVNGAVSNSREFARAFKCKTGSPMVRSHPCRIL